MSTPGGSDFEQLKRMMGQLGLNAEDLDINELMKQMQRLQASGRIGFGITSAAQDPDAAWRITITAAHHPASELDPDLPLSPGEKLAIVDAERLTQPWPDPVTRFASSKMPPVMLCREDWIESTSAGWRRLAEPVINGLADVLQRDTATPEDPQLADPSSTFALMMWTSASLIYRDRLGKVLALVAGSTLTGSGVGISLAQGSAVTVLPANITGFTRDLDLPDGGVILYLLPREASRQRLFHGVGWLSPQLDALLAHYVRGIRTDFEALSSQLDIGGEEVSLEDIVAVGEKVRGSFFKPTGTELQLEILGRLEVLLALIRGWADHVTNHAASGWMTNSAQLDEVARRRCASAGPTREVSRDLPGLESCPRLVRDTEDLWVTVEHRHGATERDEVWQHPDTLSTVQHLENPLSYAHPAHRGDDDGDLDAELRKLLGE